MPRTEAQPVIENEHGRMEISPGTDVQALSWGTWTFRWTIGREVEPGGGMDIVLVPRFPTNRWSLPQTADPTAPGHVTATASGDAIVTVDVLRWPLHQKPHGATLHVIRVGTGNRTLVPGDAIEVTYGDPRGGSLGTQAQLSARVVSFPVFVASGQEPRFFERFVAWQRHTDVATLREHADYNVSLRVVGGPACALEVVAPMEVEPGRPFDVRVAALDAVCNAATGYEGELELVLPGEAATAPTAVSVEGARARVSNVTLNTPGFQRLYVVDPNRGILGVSNPIRVRHGARPLYWGEIHGHSEQSDGNGTPDEHYTYARDVALLDFSCVCDHEDHLRLHPERWEAAQAKVDEYTQADAFVALLGYESRVVGEDGRGKADINVYYARERGELLPPFPAPLPPTIAGDQDVIVVPHSSLYGSGCDMGTHWELLADMPRELMPLVEVFSTHGNSEYYDCPRHVLWQGQGQSVLDALRKGFRLGMIGSSDYHEVLNGSLLRIQDTPRTVNNRHMQARCGLAAVWGDALTHRGLFEAMRRRGTFATSGIRAYLDLRLNGHGPGEELSFEPGAERLLEIAAAAPERIAKLEVVRNGEVVADLADGGWCLDAEWRDAAPLAEGAFYYLRMTTERTDFAWTSPIWVDAV